MTDKVDESIKADIVHWAAFYEVRMRIGQKKIFHLEAWVVKTMSLIKSLALGFDMDDDFE